VSAFRAINENSKVIDILTSSSGFGAIAPEEIEPVVACVEPGVLDEAGQTIYPTTWADGDVTLESVSHFMDDDGTFNNKWLNIATIDDVKAALSGKTNLELQTLLEAQGWKGCHFFSFVY
jgi:hypothetical protein